MAKHYYIAKEKFKFIGNNKPEISQTAWERAVDQTEGLEWYEDTYTGQEDLRLNPDTFKFKFHAVADPHPKKHYPRMWVTLNKDYDVIGINMDKVTYERLALVFELARNLDALLLENGRKIVDEAYVDKYRRP